jgi:hypothetical protein
VAGCDEETGFFNEPAGCQRIIFVHQTPFLATRAKSSICGSWRDMSEITAEQILQIKAIVDRYENFKCVECASNIKDYLTSQGIPGNRIKLYTG